MTRAQARKEAQAERDAAFWVDEEARSKAIIDDAKARNVPMSEVADALADDERRCAFAWLAHKGISRGY